MTEPAKSDAAKRAQLAALLKVRAARPKDRPLSVGQARVLRLARLAPDVPRYNVAVAYRLAGSLDRGALGAAIRQIAERHEVLRTTFSTLEGAPVQRIAPEPGQHLHAADLAGASDDGLKAAIAAEVGQVFDLEAGPLWRVALLRLGEADHALVLTMHHIVSDGWSFELFLTELSALYRAGLAGEAAPLAPLGQSYAEFGARQRAGLETADLDRQRAYWERHLTGPIPALRLPADRPGTPEDARADTVPFALPPDLSQALSGLGTKAGASLFMVMLAGFAAMLTRATGQEDLLLCTPVTGRHRAGTKELIGYFNNILPLRLDLSGDPALPEILRRTRQVALEAYKHQDVPFEELAALPALRRLALSRLLFSLDMEWPPRFALEGLQATPLPTETGAADFDLSVSLWQSGGQIRGTLRFKSDRFDTATVEALGTAYAGMLERLAGGDPAPLSALPAPGVAAAKPEPVSPEDTSPDLPRYALEQALAREWEAVFDRRPIGIRDDLHSLGASSLAVAELAERVQARFGTALPATAIFRAGTVEGMAGLLQSHDASLVDSPVAAIRPEGGRKPLFLCEGVGIYYPLVPYLPPDQPVYGLISEVGRRYPQVEEIAAHYLGHARKLQPEGPYFLGGASFGGLIAFEMAQQLHAQGEEVGLLALFDTPGPGAFRPKGKAGRMLGHARNVIRFGRPYIERKRGRRGPGPAAAATEVIAPVRDVFRRTADTYRIRPYPGRITLFALAHRDGMHDSMYDPMMGRIDPLLGWGAIAAGGVDRIDLPGEHVSILREPFVRPLGEALAARLTRSGG